MRQSIIFGESMVHMNMKCGEPPGAPNSGGSQFFINVNNNSFLNWFDRSTPSAHPVFGKVVEGYDLIEKISQVPTDARDCPEDPVKMIKITVEGV